MTLTLLQVYNFSRQVNQRNWTLPNAMHRKLSSIEADRRDGAPMFRSLVGVVFCIKLS